MLKLLKKFVSTGYYLLFIMSRGIIELEGKNKYDET
jgi:hypothetical protein